MEYFTGHFLAILGAGALVAIIAVAWQVMREKNEEARRKKLQKQIEERKKAKASEDKASEDK